MAESKSECTDLCKFKWTKRILCPNFMQAVLTCVVTIVNQGKPRSTITFKVPRGLLAVNSGKREDFTCVKHDLYL